MRIGILALQGDFALHIRMFESLGIETVAVKKPQHLALCQGLVLPGGESTTLVKLLKAIDLFKAIPEFNRNWPIFGTCAGAILVARNIIHHPVESFGLIDIDVRRNAYGTQVDSFSDRIDLSIDGQTKQIDGVFIRAPRLERIGADVRMIGFHDRQPVIVENDMVLAATFHPELTDDMTIHAYFADKVKRLI